jgi:NADPH:quinone reductase-like Zn-dependent oxidoreductase
VDTSANHAPARVAWEERGNSCPLAPRAAAFPVPALTTAQALQEVLTPAGDGLLLVNGAGGVTGGIIAALTHVRGTRVIATAGPTSIERLKRLGGFEHDGN